MCYCVPGSLAQWTVWMPKDISTMRNSCVVIPCTFMFPSSVRPYGVHGIWYFGQPYPELYPPVVFKSRTEIVHESFKDRTKLLGDLKQRNCTLQISNIGMEHSGKYYFRADLGSSNVYTYPDFSEVKVLDQPIINVPEEVVSGSPLDVTCYVPDNCPDMTPEMKWFNIEGLEDPEISSDYIEDSNTAVMAAVLSFTPSYFHNGKVLGCQVQYPNTSLSYERLISLDVKYAPREVEVNESLDVMEGINVYLSCTVDSNPPPRITWLQEDTLVWEETGQNSTLVLMDIKPNQEGLYTCIADNDYGSKNRSFYLAVKFPPRDPSVNSSLTVLEGSSVVLHCSTEGNPVPTLTWFKDGTLISNIVASDLSLLEIPDISYEGDGEYRCLAENEHGRASSSINITVEYAPVFLPESKCTLIRDGIQCECIASANPEPAIQFHLPDLNITINETESQFNYYSHTDGYMTTSMIKLKEKPSSGLHVLCTVSNMYGTETVKLELQQESMCFLDLSFCTEKFILAVVVGAIGGVVVIAFIIAAVCYISRSHRKENGAGSASFSQQPENPPILYSSVKHNLRKKVIKTELLGTKFNSILEEPYMGDENDYQNIGGLSESNQRQDDVNYASLDFSGRKAAEASAQTDSGSDYTEIKTK
ncbi:protein, partial [Polyodon spathula]|nr:MAG protein [Polyodon spathula]